MTAPLAEAGSIDTRFAAFHEANPHVYSELVTLARQLHARGYRRIGIELLFSVLRWRSMLRTTADAYGFKLNDHYTSRYARLIMTREPELAGLFALRSLRTRRPMEQDMTEPTAEPTNEPADDAPAPDPGNTDPAELVDDLDPDDDVLDRICAVRSQQQPEQ